MALDARFPREVRLRKRPDFLRVQRRGSRFRTRDLVVCWKDRPEGARFGFTVSKKVGGAVVRNQVRRWLREATRRRRHDVPPVDIVFIAHSGAATAGYQRLSEQVALAFARVARMYRPDDPALARTENG